MTDLTPRQAYWLKRVADGNGSASGMNATLRSLARREFVRVTWRENPNVIAGKFGFWILTAKGEALIAEAKSQAGALCKS